MKKLPVLLLFLSLLTLTSFCQPTSQWLRQPELARNIILFIGQRGLLDFLDLAENSSFNKDP
jgi:hypothetical protein